MLFLHYFQSHPFFFLQFYTVCDRCIRQFKYRGGDNNHYSSALYCLRDVVEIPQVNCHNENSCSRHETGVVNPQGFSLSRLDCFTIVIRWWLVHSQIL